MEFQTMYPFCLPKGYRDAGGTLHRQGQMRLATAGDELQVLRDLRVKADEGYPQTLLLSRVITALGTLPAVTPEFIEGMFVEDVRYLQRMYDAINRCETPTAQVTCPHCGKTFTWKVDFGSIG